MDKKTTFPIKFKIILITSCVLVSSICFYIYYATTLFKQDKKAYIYETSLANSKNISSELQSTLNSLKKDINVLSRLHISNQKNSIEQIIEKTKYLEMYFVFDKKKDSFKSYGEKLETSHYNEGIFKDKNGRYQLNTIIAGKTHGIFITSDTIQRLVQRNRIYDSLIFSQDGEILAGQKVKKETIQLLKSSLTDNNSVKSFQNPENNEKSLVAISSIKDYKVSVVSIISEDKAYSVTKYLINKSVYFALFILAIACIIVILFSRSLTKPIEELFDASKKIAEGDFESEVQVSSNDEIGHLGQSFNFMSSEIKRYIQEMAEKARLENEVKVAKLVQEQFFPAPDTVGKEYSIHAYSTPASECGGDWWGYYESKNKLYVVIADATGHGLPAALLTAAINSAFNSVKTILKKDADLSADQVLSFFNANISENKTDILLTSFVIILDKETNRVEYSNASHLDALVIPKKDNLSKSDIIPLIEGKGPRIGHSKESQYTKSVHSLNSGDQIILMTDGILECENHEGKQFGLRKFIKSICNIDEFNSQKLRSAIINDVNIFRDGIDFGDDVTLICLQVK